MRVLRRAERAVQSHAVPGRPAKPRGLLAPAAASVAACFFLAACLAFAGSASPAAGWNSLRLSAEPIIIAVPAFADTIAGRLSSRLSL